MTHYFTKKQALDDIKKIKVYVKGQCMELFTGKGVFSKDQLDNGSRILIENCITEENWKVLDLGCGIGTIGIGIKKFYPNIKVTMSDINDAAVKLSKMNVKHHSLDNNVIKSDVFSNIKEKFDSILLNPPQTAGKKLCNRMIEESKDHLNETGIFQLVARHNKGGAEFEKKMIEVFGNSIQIAKESGFRVYVSKMSA